MDEQISEVIVRAVADAERYPFLFVGSGLSRRYMDSPSWTELLERLCDEIIDDRYAFADYRTRAHSAVQNGIASAELPYAATLMEGDLKQRPPQR